MPFEENLPLWGPEAPVTQCDLCDEPIYAEETFYRVDGITLCADCLTDFASDYFAECCLTGQELLESHV